MANARKLNEQLHEFASAGEHVKIPRVIKAGADANATDDSGYTPLMKAAWSSHAAAVKALLEAGADVKAVDKSYGRNALHWAAADSGDGDTVKALLEGGSDINALGQYGRTALHEAAERGRVDAVKVLLAAGADKDATDEKWETPFEVAKKAYKDDVCDMLEAHTGSGEGQAASGKLPTRKLNEQLFDFSSSGEAAKISRLIKAGANVNAVNDSGYTPLMYAAWSGQAAAVKALLEAGADHKAVCTAYGKTPLHWAASDSGDADTIKALLAGGADVAAVIESNGRTPLHEAAERGRDDAVKLLLDAGADKDTTDKNWETPFDVAKKSYKEDTCDILEAYVPAAKPEGAGSREVAAKPASSLPPGELRKLNEELLSFSQYGEAAKVARVIKTGADVNHANDSGYTALMHAAWSGKAEVIKVLLENGANLETVDKSYGRTALIWAASDSGDGDTVKALLDGGAKVAATSEQNKRTALHEAASNGRLEAVKVLLAGGADVEAVDEKWETPFDLAKKAYKEDIADLLEEHAAKQGPAQAAGGAKEISPSERRKLNEQLLECAGAGEAAKITRVLGAGAEVNHTNDSGQTALMFAAWNGRAAAVKALLEAGADVKAFDKSYGRTALQWAAADSGDADTIKALIAGGSDVHYANDVENNSTPLHDAASRGRLDAVKILLEAGADSEATTKSWDTPLDLAKKAYKDDVVDVLEAHVPAAKPDVPVKAPDATSLRQLHEQLLTYASYGEPDKIRRVIRAGADVNHANESGYTALMQAAWNGHAEAVKALLAAGADMNTVDKSYSKPALHWAAADSGDAKTVKALLDAGADVETVNTTNGRTALHEAAGNGRTEAVKVLLAAGADVEAVDEKWETAMEVAQKAYKQDVVDLLEAHTKA